MDISFEKAVFIQQNKDEIECIIEEFKRLCPKIMSNTLVQMTNPDIISEIIQASEFVYNNDITPTSLKLIVNAIDNSKEYISNEDFIKCEESMKKLSSILTKHSI